MSKEYINTKRKSVNEDVIKTFLDGHDPMERIVGMDYKYDSDEIKIIYRDENDIKRYKMEYFHPFCWATHSACMKLCEKGRDNLLGLMRKYGIKVKALDTRDDNGVEQEIYSNGYRYMYYATKAMSYQKFQEFFRVAGNPIYKKKKYDKNGKEITDTKEEKQYLIVPPQEQHMIATGKRFFKGYEDYDDTLRLIFDLETQGLNPKKHRIEELGVRFNRPINTSKGLIEFNKSFSVTGVTEEEKDANELQLINLMFVIIATYQPDIITAHNGFNFDWWFIGERLIILGTTIEELSAKHFNGESITMSKRESILKLGGEIETFKQTIVPNIITTDSLHAVRRAQALDSNMEKADLKYVTKYSKIVKPNRVYVKGDLISKTRNDLEENYVFNDKNGKWHKYDPSEPIEEGWEKVTGKYIVERYLLDDLWECDKVEHRYNMPNFLICKMLPVPFQKCCTMGTAGQWKSLMLAWSFENDLAIPQFGENKPFTGGLSRLLKVGYVKNVVKLDYNSLYPSIILTWDISDNKDLMMVMLHFLKHILTEREKYKGLKKKAGKKKKELKERLELSTDEIKETIEQLESMIRDAAEQESANDKKQLPMKIFGNSFFGSYGAPNVFPWASLVCAERTTCTGRMCLRLMISHFNKLGYKPIVGDSFTEDTPMFIKYDDGRIDIKPIKELINQKEIEKDTFGREYDYSKKPFKVLCRSGWSEVGYIYRHKTDKPIYEVSDGSMSIETTEDHSLFNSNKEKIKPSEIDNKTKLEYYDGEILGAIIKGKSATELNLPWDYGKELANGKYDYFSSRYLNTTLNIMEQVYDGFMANYDESIKLSKCVKSGILYIKKRIGK